MAEYRYVLFARGKQPTADEVSELKSLASLFDNKLAWGVSRDDGRLALACPGVEFDKARDSHADFDALVHKWERRGCEIVSHLGFVKDSSALRPMTTSGGLVHDGRASTITVRNEQQGSDHLARAREAVGRSLLGVEQTLQRYAALQRFASAIPYLLILLGAVVTIGTGFYVRNRMMNSGRERRQDTIERVVDAPLDESLSTKATARE
jgi:hypothetical protein